MKLDMKAWLAELHGTGAKRPLPVLCFPAITKLGVTVREFVADSGLQARGMEIVANEVAAAAALSPMDLSVEAECFGSKIRFTDGEVPTVVGRIVEDEAAAEALEIPAVGAGRTGVYVDGVRKAAGRITDRPVLAGMIGPFSLAARLLDVGEIMVDCYDEPDMVNIVMEKTTEFLIRYGTAFREAGANGIVMAEPVSGLLSPALEEEFSSPYVRRVVEALQTDDFAVIYHNCGNGTPRMLDSILTIGAAGYHFGNAVDMRDILARVPSDVLVFGNVDPSSQFLRGTPDSVRAATLALMRDCCRYPNFVISSGCDVPPLTPWENIRAFFGAAEEYYGR